MAQGLGSRFRCPGLFVRFQLSGLTFHDAGIECFFFKEAENSSEDADFKMLHGYTWLPGNAPLTLLAFFLPKCICTLNLHLRGYTGVHGKA